MTARIAGVDRDDVVAGDEGPRMRAGARKHDCVVALTVKLGVIPTAPQIIAEIVVRGERDPRRSQTIFALGEVDNHRLPISLVIVDPVKGRAPVVHRVEVPVLQADVAALAHNSPVVGEPISLEVLAVGDLRRGGQPRRHLATQEQRCSNAGVDEAAEHSGGGQAIRGTEPVACTAPPAPVLRAAQGLLDETQVELPVLMDDTLLTQAFEGEFPCRRDESRSAGARASPRAALRHVRTDRRGKEQLPVGVTDNRLVASQQVQVRGHIALTCRRANTLRRRVAQWSTSFPYTAPSAFSAATLNGHVAA